ncbi:unnamed protein product [Cyprideis torosa]|uniref:Uncharacterized protein n=1 Tax=Cyprideis torosa TaxID=163714 RepID=A0A7R8ZLE2_9CRUS|nr:unnamed protein product [Cyprideis torosa]CAG0891605.1 unnamed protein product [Cyprideis torosa]
MTISNPQEIKTMWTRIEGGIRLASLEVQQGLYERNIMQQIEGPAAKLKSSLKKLNIFPNSAESAMYQNKLAAKRAKYANLL